ncbi:MAG: type IV pilus twitching motility protein PilT [Elusimicrobiota bacterium]|jgi:twitching motility protein PilT|nr:type IV pilus twitching motility protein PilT [Elusimicrobiota bacterium]
MVSMDELFQLMKDKNASDMHLTVGVPPVLRIDGNLFATPFETLTPDRTQSLIYSIMTDEQKQRFETNNELDFAFSMRALGRMRLNVYRQRGSVAVAIRSIPFGFKTFRQLGLPLAIDNIVNLNKGLVLVTGPTGSGKSTTLASMINFINENYGYHIMTVEDPIEFIHEHKKSIINQREVGQDTKDFASALRYVLRQDPDVILIGEMRDLETTQQALNAAETGHLVLGTLHTNDAMQTINRIIDMFPSSQQEQARGQLSFVLEAVISQQLLQTANGQGRVLAPEVLLATPATRVIIRDKKIEQLVHVMQTNQKAGMVTMNQSLGDLYLANKITYQEAVFHSNDVNDLKSYLDNRLKR